MAIFRYLLWFVILYLGYKMVQGWVRGLRKSQAKDEFQRGNPTIVNNPDNQKSEFEGGEYIDYEEVKEEKKD